MRGASVFGDERRTLISWARRLLPLLTFLVVIAAPAVAQVSNPSFVRIGPGANQAYWTDPAQFQANWGASSFGASVSNFYSYVIDQSATDPAFNVVTSGQTPASLSPPTSVTIPGPGFVHGQTYYVWVQAHGVGISSAQVVSRPFVADLVPPTVTTSSSSGPISTKATFTVSWSVTATSVIPIDHYDVQYRINGGPLRPWLSRTKLTSASFTGDNGSSYAFQVTATDAAGLTGTELHHGGHQCPGRFARAHRLPLEPELRRDRHAQKPSAWISAPAEAR